MKIPRIAYAAFGLALLIVIVDQLTKAWIISGIDLREMGQVAVLPPIFNLTWVENRGVSFGLFGDGSARWYLSVFAVVISLALAWWALRADRRLLITAIGLIMGGAIGNVIDRIRFGFVVDFLDFSGTGFFPWVFNVADSAISIGIVLLIWDSLRAEKAAKVGGAAEKS
ncbi:MAG: signal peptidase II [Brevundimonas sp.]|uniref:signal peptidase II n=1 Tax=Brevundimonas sp. TaxID=1871086 RepID=UPI001A184087|nr:signal peptidase II [Brevundimonas sp.]MBJ7448359.1 signal peptidase II [Brevundimonas sp.]